MVVLTFPEQVSSDIDPLISLEPIVFKEAVTIALNQINGIKAPTKTFNKLANLLEKTKQEVTDAITALTLLFIEGSKKQASLQDFIASLADFNFTIDQQKILSAVYEDNWEIIRDSLVACSDVDDRYSTLKWRLDIELSSRSLRHSYKPSFLLNFKTTHSETNSSTLPTDSKTKDTYLTTDYATLAYITEELERAVKESKTVHARRITRYVK